MSSRPVRAKGNPGLKEKKRSKRIFISPIVEWKSEDLFWFLFPTCPVFEGGSHYAVLPGFDFCGVSGFSRRVSL